MLDEPAARLSAIEHRLLVDGDRLRFAALVATLFGPASPRMAGTPSPQSRTWFASAGRRRFAPSASSRGARASSTRRRRASTAGPAATAPRRMNLHEPAVAMAAAWSRRGSEWFRALFAKETDPAFRRRRLLALGVVRGSALAARGSSSPSATRSRLQDVASFVGAPGTATRARCSGRGCARTGTGCTLG